MLGLDYLSHASAEALVPGTCNAARLGRAGFSVSARDLSLRGTIALLVASGMGCGAGTENANDSCPAPSASDSPLTLIVDPDAATGTVAVQGGCTMPVCFKGNEAGVGCLEWHGQMTATAGGPSCAVTFTRSDGNAFKHSFSAGTVCNRPAAHTAHIHNNGIEES